MAAHNILSRHDFADVSREKAVDDDRLNHHRRVAGVWSRPARRGRVERGDLLALTGIIARLCAAGFLLLCGMQPVAAFDGYKLLRLAGTWVKWGDPVIGVRARVTYAVAKGRIEFPDARNCRQIGPVKELLSNSRIASGLFRREVRAAFDAWSRTADITFVSVDDPAKADIVIGAQLRPRDRAYANVSFEPGGTGKIRRIRKSLVCLNPEKHWKVGFDGNTAVYDLRYTLLHEIGHAIGLDHPGPSGQVMSFKYSEKFRDLRAGDMSGASLLYGKQGAGRITQAQQVTTPTAPKGADRIPHAGAQLSLGVPEPNASAEIPAAPSLKSLD